VTVGSLANHTRHIEDGGNRATAMAVSVTVFWPRFIVRQVTVLSRYAQSLEQALHKKLKDKEPLYEEIEHLITQYAAIPLKVLR
jgi:hypothetical protein